jgi:S1-C subfamily serine protease
MNKLLLILILNIVFSQGIIHSEDYSSIAIKAKPAVLLITVNDRQGTGFFICSNGLLITNNHVVGESDIVNITTFNNKKYEAKVIKKTNIPDLALLEAISLDSKVGYLEFSHSPCIEGQKILIIGYPLSLNISITEGIISGFQNIEELGGKIIQTDAAVSPGSSGSPMINMEGKVIGIATAGVNPMVGQNLNFGVPSESILKFIGDFVNCNKIKDKELPKESQTQSENINFPKKDRELNKTKGGGPFCFTTTIILIFLIIFLILIISRVSKGEE